LIEKTKIAVAGDVYAHGFAILSLSGKTMTAEYFEDLDGRCVSGFAERFD